MKFTQWLLLQMILLRLAMMSAPPAPPAPPVALGKLSKRRISHTVVDSGQVSAAVSFASSAKDVAEPQLPESTWRCMICSDLCAVCVPAARIGSKYPFYRCGNCEAKAHQQHWRAEDDKLCFYNIAVCL
jgi:hypothetical protein